MLSSSAAEAVAVFRDAERMNLTGAGHVWIVTEQILEAPNLPIGTLALQQVHVHDEEAHIRDSLSVPGFFFSRNFRTKTVSIPSSVFQSFDLVYR